MIPGIDSSGGGGTHISDASPTSSSARSDQNSYATIGGNSGLAFAPTQTATIVNGAVLALGGLALAGALYFALRGR